MKHQTGISISHVHIFTNSCVRKDSNIKGKKKIIHWGKKKNTLEKIGNTETE